MSAPAALCDFQTVKSYRVYLPSVMDHSQEQSSSSQSSSGATNKEQPVDLSNLRLKLAGRDFSERLQQIINRPVVNFQLDTLLFAMVKAETVAETLGKMKKTAQWFNFGALLTLAGVVFNGYKTYIDRAKLEKMPFWFRVAVSVALFSVTLILAGKADEKGKEAKKLEKEYGVTFEKLYNSRNWLLGVTLKNQLQPLPPKENLPIFALPKEVFRISCSQAELTALFEEKVKAWKEVANNAVNSADATKVFFTDPTPLSSEVVRFYLDNKGVTDYATQIQQFEDIQNRYRALLKTDNNAQIIPLAQEAMDIFNRVFGAFLA